MENATDAKIALVTGKPMDARTSGIQVTDVTTIWRDNTRKVIVYDRSKEGHFAEWVRAHRESEWREWEREHHIPPPPPPQ